MSGTASILGDTMTTVPSAESTLQDDTLTTCSSAACTLLELAVIVKVRGNVGSVGTASSFAVTIGMNVAMLQSTITACTSPSLEKWHLIVTVKAVAFLPIVITSTVLM